MPPEELPRACFDFLLNISVTSHSHLVSKVNWFSSLNLLVCSLGYKSIVSLSDSRLLSKTKDDLLQRYALHLYSKDLNRIFNSNYNPFYRHIAPDFDSNPTYLTFRSNITNQRIIMQLRTTNYTVIRICHEGIQYKIFTDQTCPMCNTNKNESIDHILQVCPMYMEARIKFLSEFIATNLEPSSNTINILSITSNNHLIRVVNFVKNYLHKRFSV